MERAYAFIQVAEKLFEASIRGRKEACANGYCRCIHKHGGKQTHAKGRDCCRWKSYGPSRDSSSRHLTDGTDGRAANPWSGRKHRHFGVGPRRPGKSKRNPLGDSVFCIRGVTLVGAGPAHWNLLAGKNCSFSEWIGNGRCVPRSVLWHGGSTLPSVLLRDSHR